jgi:hypothetical protein
MWNRLLRYFWIRYLLFTDTPFPLFLTETVDSPHTSSNNS